jgi:hypothetical protein
MIQVDAGDDNRLDTCRARPFDDLNAVFIEMVHIEMAVTINQR